MSESHGERSPDGLRPASVGGKEGQPLRSAPSGGKGDKEDDNEEHLVGPEQDRVIREEETQDGDAMGDDAPELTSEDDCHVLQPQMLIR